MYLEVSSKNNILKVEIDGVSSYFIVYNLELMEQMKEHLKGFEWEPQVMSYISGLLSIHIIDISDGKRKNND